MVEEGGRSGKETGRAGGLDEETHLNPTVHKMYSKLIMNFNLKCKNHKIWGEHSNRKSLRPENRQRIFRLQRQQRGGVNKFDFVKMKNLCCAKESVKKIKKKRYKPCIKNI